MTVDQKDGETGHDQQKQKDNDKAAVSYMSGHQKNIITIEVVQLSHIDPNCSTEQTEGTSITVAQANCLRFLA